MDLSTLLQLATLVSVLIGVTSLGISIRAYRRQVSAQFLLEYTKRMDEILQSLPYTVLAANIAPDLDAPIPPRSPEVTLSAVRFLNFVSQMHYFCRKRYIPPHVWRRGQANFARILGSPFFVREWAVLAGIYESEPEFCRYDERAQRGVGTDELPLTGS